MNNSALPGDIPPAEPLEFKIPKIIVYVVILLVCTAGNMAVIGVILGSRRMRSLPGNILILNLAFVDLLTPIMSIPFDLVLEENHYVWPYGSILCKLLFPAATLLSTSSSLTLAAISLDRYRTLLHPFKSKLSVIQVKFIVAAVDCVSIVFVLPYAAFLGLQNSVCVEIWPEFLYRQIYTLFLVSVQYALPLCFMVTMYILVAVKLFATAESVRKISHPTENGRRASAAFRERLMRRESFAVSQEQNAKVTKMFVIIVVAFAICTLPNQVLWLWIDFGKDGDVTSLAKEIIVCRFFTYTNGCVNPILFFIFKRDYRRGLFKLLRKIARRKPETDLQRMRRIWKKVDISGPVTQPRRSRRLHLSLNGESPVNRHTSITSAVFDTPPGRATHSLMLNEEDSYRTYLLRKLSKKTSENISTSAERRFLAGAHLFTKIPSQKSAESVVNNEAVKDPNGNTPAALLTNSKSSVLPARSEEGKLESDATSINLLQSETKC